MKTQARWIARIAIVSSAVLVAVTVGLPVVHGQAAHVRWDIINLTPGPTVNPGGQASAMNNIGETITFTGTGTFVDPSGRGGTSSAVTGGGNWTITTASGSSSGTYEVRGLVRFEEAPGVFPGAVDNIGSPADFRSGLAVLRIEYNDGELGILVVSCSLVGSPATIFEGITASKGFTDFWKAQPPSGSPTTANANRTLFHVGSEEEEEKD